VLSLFVVRFLTDNIVFTYPECVCHIVISSFLLYIFIGLNTNCVPNSFLLLPKWHSHISSIMCLHSQINIPKVGNVYSLEQATEALQEVAAGQKSGKVIIKP
jgi:hypothetical protein